jgi:hypothetical protein
LGDWRLKKHRPAPAPTLPKMVGRIGHLPGEEVSCHSECLDLKQFERELLGQHRIADGKTTLRQETYPAYTVVACVELRDVHSIANVYAVESTSLATDHVEVIEHFKLIALAGRQVLLKEAQTLLVCLFIPEQL